MADFLGKPCLSAGLAADWINILSLTFEVVPKPILQINAAESGNLVFKSEGQTLSSPWICFFLFSIILLLSPERPVSGFQFVLLHPCSHRFEER